MLPLLSDLIVQALRSEPSVGLVEAAPWAGDPQPVVPEDATLVVLPGHISTGEWMAAQLARCPQAALLLLAGDGTTGTLVELWPERRELGELSPERLRSAAREVTPWSDRFSGNAPASGVRS